MTDSCKIYADSLPPKFDETHDERNQDQTSGKKLNNVPVGEKSRGDGQRPVELNSSVFGKSNLEAASLCSVDKMRIDQLISELDKCGESRNEMKLKLAVSDSENEVIQKMIESGYSERESEKKNLESKLLREAKNVHKFATSASRSLGILAERLTSWQEETDFITETLVELLKEKIYLQKEISNTEVKVMLLTAEESRIRDAVHMDELYLKKQEMETNMKSAFDTGCQTEERSSFP